MDIEQETEARNLINLKGENLVTWYLLPFSNVNKYTFERRFVRALVNKKGTKLYVQLTKDFESLVKFNNNKNYMYRVWINGNLYITFSIPKEFQEDVQTIINSKYSKIRKDAKTTIYMNSGLMFKKRVGDHIHSDYILQALDKTRTLRKLLSEFFEIPPDAIEGEFIGSFKEAWFIENNLKPKENE